MKIWSSWNEALDWLYWNAGDDCSILASDWEPGETSILKFEFAGVSLFYKGKF